MEYDTGPKARELNFPDMAEDKKRKYIIAQESTLIMVLLMSCCAIMQAEKKSMIRKDLLGSWEIHGTIYSNGPGEKQTGGIGWFNRYEFLEDGTYVFTAYPQLTIRGKWTLVREEGNDIIVTSELEGDGKGQPGGRYPFSIQADGLHLTNGIYKRINQ